MLSVRKFGNLQDIHYFFIKEQEDSIPKKKNSLTPTKSSIFLGHIAVISPPWTNNLEWKCNKFFKGGKNWRYVGTKIEKTNK